MELDRTERRILGSLVEKRLSTPDQYPLSINALLAACNQKSNRDPVLDLAEFEVTGALLALREKGLVSVREREGGRVPRYTEQLTGELGVSERAAAVLTELMLRGPQTAPELLRRVPRMFATQSQGQIDEALAELSGLHLARLLTRESGRRHARWGHLVAPDGEASLPAPAPVEARGAGSPPPAPPAAPAPAMESTVVEELREAIEALRDELSVLTDRVQTLEDQWR